MQLSRIPILILAAGIEIASANSQRIDIVLGQTESVDLRYGYEWPYLGVGIAPGLGQFLISKVRSDEVVPTSWNPSISIFKSLPLTEHFNLVPNLSATYWYGTGGMIGQATCGNCEEIQTREDKLYFKGGLGVQYQIKSWFIEYNPGIVFHRDYTSVIKGDGSFIRKNNGNSNFDGMYFSGSIGFKFGNN